MESPVSDGTIEENFEEALGSASMISEAAEVTEESIEDDFADVAKHGIVDVVGDDTYGRKVIIIIKLTAHIFCDQISLYAFRLLLFLPAVCPAIRF